MTTLKQKLQLAGIITAMIITGFVFAFILNNTAQVALGSTIQGSDYQATTTAASNGYGSITAGKLIKSGYGSLGTVVITGANTGVVNIYDATTTDITLRGNKATNTILVASIPASAAAGNYIFDIQLATGLYLDLVQGSFPTSTISFR